MLMQVFSLRHIYTSVFTYLLSQLRESYIYIEVNRGQHLVLISQMH